MTEAQGLDGLYLTVDLGERQLATSDLVLHAESAVDAAIGAYIR